MFECFAYFSLLAYMQHPLLHDDMWELYETYHDVIKIKQHTSTPAEVKQSNITPQRGGRRRNRRPSCWVYIRLGDFCRCLGVYVFL